MSAAERASGRCVVVTGASSGIGRACAGAFAARGDRVVLAARSPGPLEDAAQECRAAGAGGVLVVPTDVLEEKAVERLALAAENAFGPIDVWVESAAVMAYGRFDDIPAEVWRRVVETNVFGSAHSARVMLPRFRRRGSGTLILLGSLVGRVTAPAMSPYVTSKWALRGLARTLQQELRDAPGVRVCLVEPNGVNTPIYRQAGNFLGRTARPPVPVDSPEHIAAVVVRTADHPRREVLIGPTSRVIVLGFQLLPALYDVLVGPLMSAAALTRRSAGPSTGNVLAPTPEGDARVGSWWTFR